MSKLKFFALIICSLVGNISAMASRAQVNVLAEIEVSPKSRRTLGDLVQVKDGNFLLLQALNDSEIAIKETYSASEITRALQGAFKTMPDGTLNVEPQVRTSSEVNVKVSKTLSVAHIERLMLNRLNLECSDCNYQIQINRVPAVTTNNWELDFSSMSAKGSFMLPLREEGALNPIWITGNIQKKKQTAVTTRLIQQNERIQPGDIVMASVDVTWSKDSVVRIDELIGQQISRTISAGGPVWSADIKREQAAKRGQLVRVIIGDESAFEISTMMTAEDSGFIGDVIKVKNMENQKILSGLVIDKAVVKIQ